jgi:hypothetical protein
MRILQSRKHVKKQQNGRPGIERSALSHGAMEVSARAQLHHKEIRQSGAAATVPANHVRMLQGKAVVDLPPNTGIRDGVGPAVCGY